MANNSGCGWEATMLKARLNAHEVLAEPNIEARQNSLGSGDTCFRHARTKIDPGPPVDTFSGYSFRPFSMNFFSVVAVDSSSSTTSTLKDLSPLTIASGFPGVCNTASVAVERCRNAPECRCIWRSKIRLPLVTTINYILRPPTRQAQDRQRRLCGWRCCAHPRRVTIVLVVMK